MSDLFSILQSSYTSNSQSLIAAGSKFANVDPTKWAGTWTGTDDKKQPVSMSITKVSGFRANVIALTMRPKASKMRQGLHHHQEHVSDRRFPVHTDRRRQRHVLTTIVTDPNTGTQSKPDRSRSPSRPEFPRALGSKGFGFQRL